MTRSVFLPLFLGASLAGASVPELEVRAVRFPANGGMGVAIQLWNGTARPLDSLSLRVFVRAPDTVGVHRLLDNGAYRTVPLTFPDAVGVHYDVDCQTLQRSGAGNCGDASLSWTSLGSGAHLLRARPFGGLEGGLRHWAFDLPLGGMVVPPAGSLRFIVQFGDRPDTSVAADAARASLSRTMLAFEPEQEAVVEGQQGWWASPWGLTMRKVPDFADSWSFGADRAPLVATKADIWGRLVVVGNDPNILVRRKGATLWGVAPDGSGPGVPSARGLEDVSRLPYAPIALADPAGGDRGALDSALVRPGTVRVNLSGYRSRDVAAGRARVMVLGTASSFQVLPVAGGASVATGDLVPTGTTLEPRIMARSYVNSITLQRSLVSDTTPARAVEVREGVLPAGLAPGRYRVAAAGDTSLPFVVSDSVYWWVRDAALRHFGTQRSGASSWFHGPSHLRDGALEGAVGAYADGWYDAGDHLKEPQTMASGFAQLALLAALRPDADADRWGAVHAAGASPDGVPDILAEARFGARFYLASWRRAEGRVGTDSLGRLGMVTGIGDMAQDHAWWGPPELQDAARGDASRTLRRELSANVASDAAAGLALLSRSWRSRDAAWSDTALAAARSLYAWAKAHPDSAKGSISYVAVPRNALPAHLALGAVALAWATGESVYISDLAYDSTLGRNSFLSGFSRGWLARNGSGGLRGSWPTDWATLSSVTLHAFARLILLDPDEARKAGVVSEEERIRLLSKAAWCLQRNLSDLSVPGRTAFSMPRVDGMASGSVVSDSVWGTLLAPADWGASALLAADAAELLRYADVAAALRDGAGGSTLAALDWPVDAATVAAQRNLDWILGLNRWNTGFVAGIGARTLQHPHHRAANPEGAGGELVYQYRTPAGALYGGMGPGATGLLRDEWELYTATEATLDGSTQLVAAAALMAAPARPVPVGVLPQEGRHARPLLAVVAREKCLQVQVSGLVGGIELQAELLDAAGRRIASSKAVAGVGGTVAVRLPGPVGIAFLRVRAPGWQESRAVTLP